MKKVLTSGLVIGMLLAMTGCAEMGYDVLQSAAQDACYKQGEPDRSNCLRRSSTDYDTYTRERKAAASRN